MIFQRGIPVKSDDVIHARPMNLRDPPDLKWPSIPVLMTSNVKSQCSSNIFKSSHVEEISFVDSSRTKFEDHFVFVGIVKVNR